MRLKVSHFLALVVVTALSVGLLAGPASAKTTRLSAKQKSAIRAQLRKAVKKNPRVVRSKSFLKKASLVDFKLPITVRLRTPGTGALANANTANLDLGASLGQRQLSLSGSLLGYIQFHDSFDGGSLGNVDVVLQDGGAIKTSSLPLLWNPQVSSGHWYDAGFGDVGGTPGCGDFTNANAVSDATFVGPDSPGTGQPLHSGTNGKTLLIAAGSAANPGANPIPGVPYFATPADVPLHNLTGTIEEYPGVDDITALHTGPSAGDPTGINDVGPNQTPFPSGIYAPGPAPSYLDTVLRTAPITLGVTHPGTTVQENNNADGTGPQGSQNLVVGQSGGQANLFGNIPGKTHGIDVTVSLDGQINSILREVDPDFHPLITGAPYPAAAFNCRQAFTGGVHNYIPGLKLVGALHISPAITSDGKLRIAKATLNSLQPSHVGLAACLMPYSTFAADSGAGTAVSIPNDALVAPAAQNPVPGASVKCNDAPQNTVAASSNPNLGPLSNVVSTNSDGSQVSVSGDISTNISADILIGQ
jgi:hypothetical protein